LKIRVTVPVRIGVIASVYPTETNLQTAGIHFGSIPLTTCLSVIHSLCRLIHKASHYHAFLKRPFQFLRETCEGGRERTKERRNTASHCLPAAAKGDATLPCYIHPQRSLFIFQPWVFLKTIRHHGCSSSYMKFKDTKVKKRSTRRYIILRNICAKLPHTQTDRFVVTFTQRTAKYKLLMRIAPSVGIKLWDDRIYTQTFQELHRLLRRMSSVLWMMYFDGCGGSWLTLRSYSSIPLKWLGTNLSQDSRSLNAEHEPRLHRVIQHFTGTSIPN
jgi:hypothetical protein